MLIRLKAAKSSYFIKWNASAICRALYFFNILRKIFSDAFESIVISLLSFDRFVRWNVAPVEVYGYFQKVLYQRSESTALRSKKLTK